MDYLVQLLSFLGAWSAVSVILASGWARFHAVMGPCPQPRTSDHASDAQHEYRQGGASTICGGMCELADR